MTWFNLLLDLECHMGSTSKLAKILKDTGFSPKIVAYNILRLRYRDMLDNTTQDLLSSKIKNLLSIVEKQSVDWKVMCIETWIEKTHSRYHSAELIKEKDLCLFARSGPKGRIVVKIAWIDQCVKPRTSLISESITRLCIESEKDVERHIGYIKDKIIGFISSTRDLMNRF